VTLFNNRGVNKPQQGMAQVDRSKLEGVDILFRSGELKSASEWTTDAPLKINREGQDSRLSVEVPPGGVRIVELVPKP